MAQELSPLSRQIWDMKYRLKHDDGTPVDGTLDDTWDRVADTLAHAEAEPETWRPRFRAALEDCRFLPAGRIIAGAGSGRRVTLFNCFVMGEIPDDMGGIFAHLREAALTLQQGGGIGYDFSTLRPKGAPVAGVGADASGPLSFMEVWDAMCATIMSAGSRRGAMMATMACDHPDIEAFIDAKQSAGRLTNFNLSVLVSDAFMRAVAEDDTWPLAFGGRVFKVIRARELWERVMRATYDSAEPGVIFIDRINQANNLSYVEEIRATNPCGEQPLPPYGACLLGSVNLARLVRDPFTAEARIARDELDELVQVAVRMLDNAIDASGFPLPEQRAEAQAKRRIGLGVTGLADALIMCGLRYGGTDSVAAVEDWMTALRDAAYRASARLAAEKGPFPLFDRERLLEAPMVRALPDDLRREIAEHGLRNGLLTSIAPTGTISLLADNVSSGIEPVFSFEHSRTVLLPDGSREDLRVADHAYRRFRAVRGPDAPLSDAFVDAQSLEPAAHVVMQATVQRYIDSAVSKTVNVPVSLPFEAFKDLYRQAYELGCKGCTTYRPSEVRGAVLRTDAPTPAATPALAAAETPTPPAEGDVVYMTQPLERPTVLPGRTYKLKWPVSDHALYITINDVMQDGRRRPFEVFINSKNMEHYAWSLALTRMISAVFRRGGDVSFVVEELKAVFDPRGGAWLDGHYVPSLLAAIGDVIETHMIEIGFLPAPEVPVLKGAAAVDSGTADPPASARPARQCPKCGSAALIRQEGCDLCTRCAYSRCA